MIVFLIFVLFSGTISSIDCPVGYFLTCSGSIGVQEEKCCTCQPIPGKCPGGYTSGLSSCSVGFKKVCVGVSGKECCACFVAENSNSFDKPDGCDLGFAAGITSSDCPKFNGYNVVLECRGQSNSRKSCCKCKLIPMKDSSSKGEVIDEDTQKECPHGYSRKIGKCPIIFGVQSTLNCLRPDCCKCEVPEVQAKQNFENRRRSITHDPEQQPKQQTRRGRPEQLRRSRNDISNEDERVVRNERRRRSDRDDFSDDEVNNRRSVRRSERRRRRRSSSDDYLDDYDEDDYDNRDRRRRSIDDDYEDDERIVRRRRQGRRRAENSDRNKDENRRRRRRSIEEEDKDRGNSNSNRKRRRRISEDDENRSKRRRRRRRR